MNSLAIITIITSITSLVGVFTGFLLQKDNKKIRDLERKNSKYKSELRKSLEAILCYQEFEELKAIEENKNLAQYRASIRKELEHKIDAIFVQPGKIQQIINDLDSE